MIANPVKTRRQWWAFDSAMHQEMIVFSGVARRRLQDEGIRAAAAYRRHGRPGALAAIEDNIWIDYLKRVWSNVVDSAGAHTLEVLGREPAAAAFAAAAAGYLKRNAAARGGAIAATSRKTVSSAIEEGERLQDLAEQMARRIIAKVDGASGWRSRTIGATEVHAAAGLGSLTAALQAPRLVKVWAGPRGERITCDQHKTVRGQRRGVREAFEVINDYEPDATADRLMYPGDGELGARAANVINCRCWMEFQDS